MMRLCPNCGTERPLTEVFCEGVVAGGTCHWDLSTVDIRPPGSAPTSPRAESILACPQGHPIAEGDLICPICEAPVETGSQPPMPPPEPGAPTVEETIVEEWRLGRRLPSPSGVRERFVAVHTGTGRQAILTLYAAGSEPDPAVYDMLRKLPRDHVPEIITTGRWRDRAFEVAEELTGGTLASLDVAPGDLSSIHCIVEQLGRALHAFSEAGLRHRDLRPAAILVRSRDPLDLVVSGFGSARMSEFDLDIVSPLETTRYTAPEAIAGGVAAASDWWSLGILLLEKITAGACFEGVNDQAFLIRIVTNGAPIPVGLDPTIELLLRGLLARDRDERWKWDQVRAWLAGEAVAAPEAPAAPRDVETGPTISLADKPYRTASAFALAAAEAAHWDEAREKLLRGVVATWAEDAALDKKVQAGLRQLTRTQDLSDDLRLSLALKLLHPGMPMIARGNILTPGWLLDHPLDGYELITGPAPDFLRKLDAEPWLSRLKARVEAVRTRADQLEIAVAEDELRVHLLSTSMARLGALWEERRRLLPDSDHPGLASLIDRRQTAEEDLILLLGASVEQFRSAAEIVEQAAEEARTGGISGFDKEAAAAVLAQQRRDIYRTVGERIENFARCGIASADMWADQFRLDRRMPIARALALLAIPAGSWRPLPKQDYVSTILDFFAKKISGGVLRGPLARMTIGKSSARVDVTELGSPRRSASDLLSELLSRNSRNIDLDPAIFAERDTLERRLRALHSHALLYRRDTGIDGLYLGFPFLLMRNPSGNTLPRIAPVLLWPARINPEVGNRGHVTIGFGRDHDGDPDQVILNPAFEGIIGFDGAREWQEAADDLLTRASISVADALNAFGMLATARGESVTPLPGKDVEVRGYEPQLVPSAVLFHLTFMGQGIVKDLDHFRGRDPAGTGLETALRLGQRSDRPAPAPAVHVHETDRYFTASSDPSQESAVLDARTAPGMVVEGPPGTGKSQTIVNMVGDAIGRQKSLLIICQKQAALDVVRKRLEKENLGQRIIMITDINRDREPIVRSVREQVEALHARPPGGAPERRRERERLAARIESLEAELDRHQAALHRVDPETGLTYRTLLGELLALEAAQRAPVGIPALRSRFASLKPMDITTLEEACAPLARYWLPAAYEGSPLAVVKSFSPDRGTVEIFIDTLRGFVRAEAARERINAETSDSFEHEAVGLLRAWVARNEDAFLSMSPALCANLARWLPLFRPRGGSTAGATLVSDLEGAARDLRAIDASMYAPAMSAVVRSLSDDGLDRAVALAVSVVAPRSWLGRINPLRWLERRRLRSLLASLHVKTTEPGISAFAAAGSLEQSIRPLRLRVNASANTLLGRTADAVLAPAKLGELAGNLHSIVARVQALVAAIDDCPVPQDMERAAAAGEPVAIDAFFQKAGRTLAREDAREDSLRALDAVSLYFDEAWVAARRSAVGTDKSNAGALTLVFERLPTLTAYQEFRLRSSSLGETEFELFRILRTKEAELLKFETGELDGLIRNCFAREARLAWKLRIEAADPSVLLDAGDIDTKIRALGKADEDIRRCNRELLVNGIDAGRVRPARDWQDITRLRGRRSLRLREFFDRATDLGLMALRPVWLMTPDVASRVLQPKAGMFDTVIYDEASQMPVEYALPTLFRSKIVVVSGDEKQMPPTSFFASKVENDEAALFDGEEPDESATEQERDEFAETWNRREIKDCPDLLHLARVVLEPRMLQVHYRSAYRELIAFSNASFYGNRLSVPVRHPDDVVRKIRPIEVIRSNGIYVSQTNPTEATDVVSYLARLWKEPAPPSAGVVTFNRKQAEVIEEALEHQAEEDDQFRDALMRERERAEGGEDMGFFVKNVENVQGDERDVIIFSSTFGPNAEGTFRRNFGVLGQAGGERRLNVGVTRARQKVVMVTSMPIAKISEMLTTRKPPSTPRDYLQVYLEYARMISDGEVEAGRTLLGRMVTERTSDPDRQAIEVDGFTESVESCLRELGWAPAKARGGAFGLDFAIVDARTGLYGIGIECDAPRHRILSTARAREVWRPKVLRQAIPHVHRVSSHAWFHSGDAERHRLKTAVENALGVGGPI
jgi:hypothetical protein